MFSAPSTLWAWRKTLLFGAVAALIGFLWWRTGNLAEQRDLAISESARWKTTAFANAQAVDDLKAAHTRAIEAVERVSADAAARGAKTTIIRQEIASVPDTSTCGPALAVAADGLRSLFQPPGDPD